MKYIAIDGSAAGLVNYTLAAKGFADVYCVQTRKLYNEKSMATKNHSMENGMREIRTYGFLRGETIPVATPRRGSLLYKSILAVAAVMFFCVSVFAAETVSRSEDLVKLIPQETDAQRWERMKWWTDSRFGMFLHFGIYSLAARHEKVILHEVQSGAKYRRYFENFNPDLFDARQWARQANACGMKYAVLTAKHHDGFCLFDSKHTDYKSTNTPFGRDIVREYADAFRAEGLKVGLYYSLIDWHHPDFTFDVCHPRWKEYRRRTGRPTSST